ncbi:MAG: DUF5020 family protein [Bacteroidaceae bacterium]|nr:DUF5020 family protein [Bacteroidaceae bacterium]
MKKIFLLIALLTTTVQMSAQLNVQMHHDFGNDIYGSELSNRPRWTATIENFTADKWGSTYFFVDGNFADNTLASVYAELARELRFWEAPIALHVEYNGGLAGATGSYNDAYLVGAAWNWANKDFSHTFSVQALYKYLANNPSSNRHSWQLTTVWGIHFAKGLCTFSGYADLWHDNSVNGSLVLSSEPQFWVNLWKLNGVDDDCKLSVGTEVEICNNLVWPTDGVNNRFYVTPTLAAKWTF